VERRRRGKLDKLVVVGDADYGLVWIVSTVVEWVTYVNCKNYVCKNY
jgi:hypothetical protein